MSETQIKTKIENDDLQNNMQSSSSSTVTTSANSRVSPQTQPQSSQSSKSSQLQPVNELQTLDSTNNGNDDDEHVNAVVTKAKRAATFLWALLHAQKCTYSQCPHNGCGNAKQLLLHIKTCPATSEGPCPSGHPGCQQARKLMAHYHKCKEMRIRQRLRRPICTSTSSSTHFQQPTTNFCLICTMLARHDKGISENPSFPPSQSPRIMSPLPLPAGRRRKPRSKSVQFDLKPSSQEIGKVVGHHSPKAMAPPPPRSSLSKVVPLTSRYNNRSLKSIEGNRPRSGSLDERRLPSDIIAGNDPTVEMELRGTKSDESPLNLHRSNSRQLPFRKRSVSCSVLSHQKPRGCDTIMEE